MTKPDLVDSLNELAQLIQAAALKEATALEYNHKHECYEGDIDWYEVGRIACALREISFSLRELKETK